MKTKSLSITIFLFVCLCSFISWGQETEPEKGQLWYCWEATVHASMENQFLGLIAEEKAFFEETNDPIPYYVWTDGSFHYYFFSPLESYDDISLIVKGIEALFQEWGEEKISSFFETLEYHEDYFLRHQPGISYVPEVPRLKEDELNFAIWDICFVSPGKENEIFALAQEYAALLKEKNYKDEVQFYTGDLGYGGSIFIGALKGKNPSDFWNQNSKMWELIGDEGKKIFQRWMLLVNKREFKQFWYLKELSFIPD